MINSWFIPPIFIPILIGLGLVKYVHAQRVLLNSPRREAASLGALLGALVDEQTLVTDGLDEVSLARLAAT